MKIVLINQSSHIGGAAVACMRLAQALVKADHQVTVITLDPNPPATGATSLLESSLKNRLLAKYYFLAERLQIFYHNGRNRANLFRVDTMAYGFDLTRHPAIQESEVIHFHWINQGMMDLKGLGKLLSLGKKVVWTLHDLWPLMGICHYHFGCNHYLAGCGACPYLQEKKKDLSARIFAQKQALYTYQTIDFVGCSQWISQAAQQSPLAKGHRFHHIPNPIDTVFYTPASKAPIRQKKGLPLDKKLILFGAANLSSPFKGVHLLWEAIQQLPEGSPFEIVVFGNKPQDILPELPFPVHAQGYIHEASHMRELYQACDLFVIPSLEENLPNVVMEAMACGTPCVGFTTGGIPEMIIHHQTGVIAQEKTPAVLAQAILEALESKNDPLGRQAREWVMKYYNEEIIAKQYLAVYSPSYSV